MSVSFPSLARGLKAEPGLDPLLELGEPPPVRRHSDEDHDDHDRDDLSDVDEIAPHLKEEAEAVTFDGEDEFRAHEGAPGEGKSLAKAAGHRRKARREQDVAVELPAPRAHHHAGPLV